MKFGRIWIETKKTGIKPSYEQKSFKEKQGKTILVSYEKEEGSDSPKFF